MKIKLTQGKTATIDSEDFEKVSKYKWCAWRGDKIWYAIAYIPGTHRPQKFVRLHRIIANAAEGMEVDHINYNGLDCRKSNLRVCTKSQNGQNREMYRCNKSGYKGVFYRKASIKRPYIANITKNNRRVYIGTYATAEEAAIAYNNVAKKLFGEFARLNDVQEDHPKS